MFCVTAVKNHKLVQSQFLQPYFSNYFSACLSKISVFYFTMKHTANISVKNMNVFNFDACWCQCYKNLITFLRFIFVKWNKSALYIMSKTTQNVVQISVKQGKSTKIVQHWHQVVLCGWAGATPKNLHKYSEIYNRAGCLTLDYNLPSRYQYH